jgi:hypothetical protein
LNKALKELNQRVQKCCIKYRFVIPRGCTTKLQEKGEKVVDRGDARKGRQNEALKI